MEQQVNLTEDAIRKNESWAKAMNECQAEVTGVIAKHKNPHFGSSYAKLNEVLDALRPVWTKHGFSVVMGQDPKHTRDGYIMLVAYVIHKSGGSVSYHLEVPYDDSGPRGQQTKTGVHAMVSATSYGCRLLYGMIFALSVDKDDDGISAGQRRQGGGQVNLDQKRQVVLDLLAQTKTETGAFFDGCSKQFNREIKELEQLNDEELTTVIGLLTRKLNKQAEQIQAQAQAQQAAAQQAAAQNQGPQQ